MDFITQVRALRAIEATAKRYGYRANATLDHRTLPDTGTYQQQLHIAEIGLDAGIRLGDLSTREREFVGRLIRSCVLSTPSRPRGRYGRK